MADHTREPLTPRLRQDYYKRLTEKRKTYRWTGWLCVVIGILAILFPFTASLSINIFAGVLFAISGGVMLHMPHLSPTAGRSLQRCFSVLSPSWTAS